MPILLQNIRVTCRSPKDLGKFLCKCWPQSSVKFAMIIDQRFHIGSETMLEKASTKLLTKIPGVAHYHVQTTSLVNLTIVVGKSLKLVGRHLLAILLVNHD